MADNAGGRHNAVRNITGTNGDYAGDWNALFAASGISAGDYSGQLLQWINLQLGTAYSDINGAMWAFAQLNGKPSWNELGDFSTMFIGNIPRKIPAPDYAWFDTDFQVTGCAAPGAANLSIRGGQANVIQYAMARRASDLNANTRWIAPWGNDANAGTGPGPGQAWLTLTRARSDTSSFLNLTGFDSPANGLSPADFRNSDSAGGKLKVVRGVGGKQWISTPGPDISQSAWTNTASTYSITMTRWVARVLSSGTIVGPDGLPIRMRCFGFGAAALVSLNSVATNFGWVFDPATPGAGTGTLYVRFGGNTIAAYQPGLRAVYAGTEAPGTVTGTTGRILNFSSKLAFDNVGFEGVLLWNFFSTVASELYINNCTFRFNTTFTTTNFSASSAYGIFNDSGSSYIQNSDFYANTSDAINYKNNSAAPPAMLEWNIVSREAGDWQTFGSAADQSSNASSNDSSGSTGLVAINGIYTGSSGPSLPHGRSWTIGSIAGQQNVDPNASSPPNGDFFSNLSGASMYCDTCRGDSRYGFVAGTAGSNIALYNCTGTTLVSGAGATLTSYQPF